MATNEPAISRFLDTVGDGTGVSDATGDYSVSPVTFIFRPAADQLIQVATFEVSIKDMSIVSGRYGNIMGGLVNGYVFRLKDDVGGDQALLAGRVFKTSADFAASGADASVFSQGAGGEVLTATWNLRNRFDVVQGLNGATGQRIEVTLNDDFTGLDEHRFQVQGYIDT